VKPSEVRKIIGDVPNMDLDQATKMTDFIQRNGIKDVLELGFCFGVSTCYIAAALDAGGGGSVVTIDREEARTHDPNIEQLLGKVGLRSMVTCYFEPTSYTWRMMKMLEESPAPRFDFCYLDGAHSWFVDGFAFFLIDRLLRPGGWIIFDDLDWSYSKSPTLRNSEWVRSMPDEERTIPQVRKVYELLVKPHGGYGDFRTEDNWAYAHKLPGGMTEHVTVRQEVIVKARTIPWTKLYSRLKRSLR
jgi:predicted O-methyltransferase YrrM